MCAAAGCSSDDEADSESTETATSQGPQGEQAQVLKDFCIAAGLVKFMSTGEDLRLWAESLGTIERPEDFGGDAEAGLEILREYAAQVPPEAVAEELVQPEYSAEQQAQLEAYSTYLESCPQVQNPPTSIPSSEGETTG